MAAIKNDSHENRIHGILTRKMYGFDFCVWVCGHCSRLHWPYTHVASRYYLKKELSDQCVCSHVYHFIFYWYRDPLYSSIHNPQLVCELQAQHHRQHVHILYAQMANDLNFIHGYLLFPSIKSIKYVSSIVSQAIAVQCARLRDTFCCCISIICNQIHNNSVKTHFRVVFHFFTSVLVRVPCCCWQM